MEDAQRTARRPARHVDVERPGQQADTAAPAWTPAEFTLEEGGRWAVAAYRIDSVLEEESGAAAVRTVDGKMHQVTEDYDTALARWRDALFGR